MSSEREGKREESAAGSGNDDLGDLLDRNRAWAASKTGSDPSFFQRLVGQQRPRYFWIGCSDSRVPATEIVALDPGEMFVHRNVANICDPRDPNFAAALEFAVGVLEVRHIIVVGHYGCGGIQAAMGEATEDAIGRWLVPIRELHRRRSGSADAGREGPDGLCRHNVVEQVEALRDNPVVRAAWAAGRRLSIHGWVYAIGDGLLKPVRPPLHGPAATAPPAGAT
jgi:carbonic anhydrase